MRAPGTPEVDATTAAHLVSDGTAILLDVRETDEWAAGHAPGARHVPLGNLDPDTIPDDRPVIAVCRSGRRSATATAQLRAAGLDASNLTGGMTAWARAGLPVRTDDGRDGTVA
ncbi:rhodanese-like domain-containing protein [Salinispora arenicola]|uniref:rhodanese-like domain-containing protein n=1 Tax=Salinispora arenicola TaxID=168697 RepID=UPI000373A48D|nr:rhodanese-like domain-containing protein [Salinispora arenicola]